MDVTEMDMTERDARLGAALRRLVELAAADPVLRDGLAALVEVVQGLGRVGVAQTETVDATPTVEAPATVERPRALKTVPAVAPLEVSSVERAVPEERPVPVHRRAEDTQPMDLSAFAALVDAALAGRPTAPIAASDGAPPASVAAVVDEVDPDETLPGIRDHAALKAELARAVAQRMRVGTPVAEELLHRARSTGASTWPMDLLGAGPEVLERLAVMFDAVSDAIDLVHLRRSATERDRPRIETAMRALAAVQSALRVVVASLRRWPDEDQVAAFGWLKATTQRERIYIERHMRLDDPLDPERVEDAMEVVREDLDHLREEAERRETRARQLKRLKYHAQRLARDKGSDDDLDKVIDATCAAVDAGVPPSSLEIREQLAPLLSRLPEESVPRQLALVIREIDAAQAAARESRRQKAAPAREDNAEVRLVAQLLRGSSMVMIGGEERVEARRALIEAFHLDDLDWLTLSDDPSPDELERVIGKPGVSVVLCLIRWARHAYGDARVIAEEHDVPFVRIPGGYNESAVAHEILEQASERLRAKAHLEGVPSDKGR